jgi:hypothetical protein
MQLSMPKFLKRPSTALVFILALNGCGGSYEETVAGIKVPIPNAMKKAQGNSIEISLPGFGGGQASFQGKMDPDKVIDFYKKEMADRGWTPNLSLVSRGGMLAYTKEGKSVLVTVGKSEATTTLTITVGGGGK